MSNNVANTAQIRKALQDAEKIVFLGFAFHPQNINLVFKDNKDFLPSSCSIYGTAFQVNEKRKSLLKSTLSNYFTLNNFELAGIDVKCNQFVKDYYDLLLNVDE
jgi:hypothetical protein